MRTYQTRRQIAARKERIKEYLDWASFIVSIAGWIGLYWLLA